MYKEDIVDYKGKYDNKLPASQETLRSNASSQQHLPAGTENSSIAPIDTDNTGAITPVTPVAFRFVEYETPLLLLNANTSTFVPSPVVMCMAWLGLKAPALARLLGAQAFQNLELSRRWGLRLGPAWLWPEPRLFT